MKSTWPMREFCVGDPTRPIFHLFALGVMQICAFLDANMLVSPTQNSRVGGIAGDTRRPKASVFASLWNTGSCTQGKSPRTQYEPQHELMEYSLRWVFAVGIRVGHVEFHIVCVNFILPNTNAAFGRIWALVFTQPDYQRLKKYFSGNIREDIKIHNC